MTSVFTRIMAGELPGQLVWSDETAVALMSIAPLTEGHALVVPRAEVDHLTDADDALLGHLMAVAKRVGAAQKAVWGSPRAAVTVAGFEVPHLHLHVFPAGSEADLNFANARPDTPAEQVAAAAVRLRAALRDAGHTDHVPS